MKRLFGKRFKKTNNGKSTVAGPSLCVYSLRFLFIRLRSLLDDDLRLNRLLKRMSRRVMIDARRRDERQERKTP